MVDGEGLESLMPAFKSRLLRVTLGMLLELSE